MPLTTAERLKANLFLKVFALKDVPLIGTVGARIVDLDEECCVISIPLKRRNKNHLGSMYFGVLAVGADCAGGMIAMREIQKRGGAASLVFKDFHAEFLKRPEAETFFTCRDGAAIRAALEETLRSGERVNLPVHVVATCPDQSGEEPVARFRLTLSLKKRTTAAGTKAAQAA